MDEYKRKFRADLRLCAAMIGCSAVIAMAAIGLMVVQEHDGAAAAKTGPMAVGATSSQTTPSNALAVGVVKPVMKGPAPLPSELEAAK
ncbi:MAG: hypothetical protein ACXWZI_16140 [Mycobacterium sp.]